MVRTTISTHTFTTTNLTVQFPTKISVTRTTLKYFRSNAANYRFQLGVQMPICLKFVQHVDLREMASAIEYMCGTHTA